LKIFLWGSGEDLSVNEDKASLPSKESTTAGSRDHFQVKAEVPVTNLNPNSKRL
jgi:hypothetical protein